jgi:hypothetical protein
MDFAPLPTVFRLYAVRTNPGVKGMGFAHSSHPLGIPSGSCDSNSASISLTVSELAYGLWVSHGVAPGSREDETLCRGGQHTHQAEEGA